MSRLLLYFVESSGATPWFVHALGLCIVTGRVLHAVGVSQVRERFVFRVLGMALTFTPRIPSALRLLHVYWSQAGG